MQSNFLSFEMHGDRGYASIKPGEIVSMSEAPEGGTRIVTRQNQVYYVVELQEDVDSMIRLYFKKLKGEF